MIARRFAVQLATRLLGEALIERMSRSAARDDDEPDMLMVALCLVAWVLLPLYWGSFVVWVLTGRGPGCRLFQADRGGPRMGIGLASRIPQPES